MPSNDDLQSVTRALCACLTSHYVFPEVAARAAEQLELRAAAPDEPQSGEQLAERLTTWAQDATRDKHVRVRHFADGAPTESEAKAQFLASFRARARSEGYGIAHAGPLPGGVGLLELTNFFDASVAGEALVAAMQSLATSDVLVVDLRRNGGGEPGSVALVCSYLFDGDPHRTHLNDLVGPGGTTEQWWTLPYVPGSRLGHVPVYILTSSRTFSAAEEFAYDLQALGRATVVGEQTRGGAHTVEQFRLTDHYAAMIPNGRAVNPITGTNWQETGVAPDLPCPADEALEAALTHWRSLPD